MRRSPPRRSTPTILGPLAIADARRRGARGRARRRGRRDRPRRAPVALERLRMRPTRFRPLVRPRRGILRSPRRDRRSTGLVPSGAQCLGGMPAHDAHCSVAGVEVDYRLTRPDALRQQYLMALVPGLSGGSATLGRGSGPPGVRARRRRRAGVVTARRSHEHGRALRLPHREWPGRDVVDRRRSRACLLTRRALRGSGRSVRVVGIALRALTPRPTAPARPDFGTFRLAHTTDSGVLGWRSSARPGSRVASSSRTSSSP